MLIRHSCRVLLLTLATGLCTQQIVAAQSTQAGDASTASIAVASGQVEIHLKNGNIIHADAVRERGEKIQYDRGESTYQIPRSLVLEVVDSKSASVVPARKADGPSRPMPESRPAEAQPRPRPDTAKELTNGASIREIRDWCDKALAHASELTKDDREHVEYLCTIVGYDMGSEYEKKVDRAAFLQQRLCQFGHGRMPESVKNNPAVESELRQEKELLRWFAQELENERKIDEERGKKLITEWDREVPNWRTGKLTDAESKRMADINKKYLPIRSPEEEYHWRLRGLRHLVDLGRLNGSCGHGY